MKKIMIVDDDEEFLEEMTEILKLSGYDLIPLDGGSIVLKKAEELKPDIIILDLKLGRESGFDIARELKRNPQTSDIPIVGITGYYTEEEYDGLMRVCGIKRHLIKPISPQDLVATVQDVLEQDEVYSPD